MRADEAQGVGGEHGHDLRQQRELRELPWQHEADDWERQQQRVSPARPGAPVSKQTNKRRFIVSADDTRNVTMLSFLQQPSQTFIDCCIINN